MQLRALLHKTLTRVRSTAERWSHYLPPTWRGFFVALASGLALEAYGYASLDLLLFVIGISGLVLTVLSSLTVGGAALYLRRKLVDDSTGARQLEAGSPIRTGFHTPSLVRLPLVHIHWRWVEPEGVDCRLRLRDGRLKEEVVARRRCLVGGIHRRVTVYDAFGLARIAWDHHVSAPLQVLPDVGRLRRMPVLQSMAAAEGTPHPAGTPEGDRMEIRRYVPGDSPRHILWKIYARTGQLNVRLPERSIDPAKKTVAYLLTGEGDEASAAAARVALENGLLGVAWLFGADGSREPLSELPAALEAIARSGSSGVRGPGQLQNFLHHPEVRKEMHCIVFAPAQPGPWMDEVLAAGRSFAGQLTFVLGTDGAIEERPTPLWRRLLFYDEPVSGPTRTELQQLVRTLSSAGRSVLVVDRSNGRVQSSGNAPMLQSSLGVPA